MIARSKKRLIWCYCLLCLNLAFIWGNSMMAGDASGAFSEFIRGILAKILPISDTPGSGHVLRKLAHWSEFACLGVLLSWLFAMLWAKPGACAALPLLCGLLAACVDESIQLFTPGRFASVLDVGIDTAGIAAGILALHLGRCLFQKSKKFNHHQEETK